MAMHQGLLAHNPAALARGIPSGYFQMIDSAFPENTVNLHGSNVTLTYIGGDTPHPWTSAENAAAAQRTPLLWPCWVRSNPGQVNAAADASACVSRLHSLGIPQHTNVILDLETAVNASYVNAFNTILNAAGYSTCKYGSAGFIWQNPKTSGGTFVANPGIANPITMGDCVATQFLFAGSYDLSWVDDSVNLWEAGNMAITNADAQKIADYVGKNIVSGTTATTVDGVLRRADDALPAIAASLAAIKTAVAHQVDPAAVATAVLSQLAAQGFTADEIAQHILAGLPAELGNSVVAAMAAALAN